MDVWIGSTSWLFWIVLLMNIGVQISLHDPVFNSFGYRPRSGISGSHGSSTFHSFKNLCRVFHSSCSILQSRQQCTSIPVSPDPHQRLFCFLKLAILMGVCVVGILHMISFLFLNKQASKCKCQFYSKDILTQEPSVKEKAGIPIQVVLKLTMGFLFLKFHAVTKPTQLFCSELQGLQD